MLNRIRKGVKSLPAKILIAVLVISFAVWGIDYNSISVFSSNVMRVGDTKVPLERFANDLQREQSRLARELQQLVTYDQMRAAGFDRQILVTLAREAAYQEERQRLGLDAPDPEVARAIREDPAFRDPVEGKFSTQSYLFVLDRMNMSAAEFENSVRPKLIRRLLEETASAAVTAPPGVAPRIAAWQGEERSATILTLPVSLALEPPVPDDATLQAFYDANPPLFTEPERRSGQYIHVNAAKLVEEFKPDEEALRHAYETSQDRFTVQGSRTVDQIVYPDTAAAVAAQQRLLSGSVSFDDLATEQGLTAETLSLGRVTRDDLPEAAAAALFAVTEPGIVGPVALPAGAALFRITELSEGGVTPFEAVRGQLTAELARQSLDYRSPELANKVEELRAEGLTFEEIAKRSGADHGSFEGLARDGSLAGGGFAEGVQATPAFLDDVFAALPGEERGLAETPQGGYIVVSVREVTPSELKPLEAVRDDAIAAWQAEERRKAIAAMAEDYAARLGEDASIWDIGEELGLTAEPLPPFTQLTPPRALPEELALKLFKLPVAAGASALAADGQSAIVAQLSEIKPLAPEAVERSAGEIEAYLETSLAGDAAEYFARAVMQRHPASYNVDAIDEVFRRLGASSAGGQ